jgi:pilus assembly protein Flp/PilA
VGVRSARETAPLFLMFTRCQSGATAIEYALIAALIAVVLIGGINAAGGSLLNTMEYVGAAMERAAGFGAG